MEFMNLNPTESLEIFTAPTIEELEKVLDKIIQRAMNLLEKRGLICRDENNFLQLNLSQDDVLASLQAGAVTYRFAIGPNKGKNALTLQTLPETDHTSTKGLVVKKSGFSLHAGVAMNGGERDKIEKLCRYIARPPVAIERLTINPNGQVVYKLKRPYNDGTTHIVMTPLQLLERLAAIVPRPRVHLTRFSGAFASHYKYRSLIVPKPKQPTFPVVEKDKLKSRMSWARLLKRVFNIDVSICNKCGANTKIIAAIEDPKVIKKILTHLGLPWAPPLPWPATGPPTPYEDFDQQSHFDLA